MNDKSIKEGSRGSFPSGFDFQITPRFKHFRPPIHWKIFKWAYSITDPTTGKPIPADRCQFLFIRNDRSLAKDMKKWADEHGITLVGDVSKRKGDEQDDQAHS